MATAIRLVRQLVFIVAVGGLEYGSRQSAGTPEPDRSIWYCKRHEKAISPDKAGRYYCRKCGKFLPPEARYQR